jgi:hypothetical protein
LLNRKINRPSSLATPRGGQIFCAHVRRGINYWLAVVFFHRLLLPLARGLDNSPADTNLISANTPLWTESMLWDKQFTFASGVGYKDNVLLSAYQPRGSGYWLNGLDAIVTRVPLDGWQIVGSLIGEDLRYWRNNLGTSGEDSLAGSLRVERELPAGWQVGLETRGIYEHQVLDTSTALGVPATVLVDGEGFTVQPSLRKIYSSGVWLKCELPVTRWSFETPLDNYWEFGPVATAGLNFGQRADVTVSYGAAFQDHDTWRALDAYGRPLPQALEILQHRVELAWHQYWDAHHRWRSSTRLIFADKVDNGGGYFNFYQYQVVEDLRWQTADWQIKASAQLAYEDYPVQGVGILNGETLNRKLLNVSLDAERRVFKALKAYANIQYESALSNAANGVNNYHGTTVAGGVRYEF